MHGVQLSWVPVWARLGGSQEPLLVCEVPGLGQSIGTEQQPSPMRWLPLTLSAPPAPAASAPASLLPAAWRSFTLLMSKGYLQAVETLRNRLMASEWELGLRPIALQV